MSFKYQEISPCLTLAVEVVEVFSLLKSDNTPQHTTHKKSHCDEWLFTSYFFFNKLSVGSTSLKLKMTSSFFNPSAAIYFFKATYLMDWEGKY